MSRPSPVRSPDTYDLDSALRGSAPLVSLMERLAESRRCLADVRAVLPDTLREQVSAGGLDDKGWTLLASSGAVAAKLRQLLPELQAALLLRGQSAPIRIRVRSD